MRKPLSFARAAAAARIPLPPLPPPLHLNQHTLPTSPIASIKKGLAAGLMLSISIMELLPDAVAEVGFVTAQLWFYAGAAAFAALVAALPEPDLSGLAPGGVAPGCASLSVVLRLCCPCIAARLRAW